MPWSVFASGMQTTDLCNDLVHIRDGGAESVDLECCGGLHRASPSLRRHVGG